MILLYITGVGQQNCSSIVIPYSGIMIAILFCWPTPALLYSNINYTIIYITGIGQQNYSSIVIPYSGITIAILFCWPMPVLKYSNIYDTIIYNRRRPTKLFFNRYSLFWYNDCDTILLAYARSIIQ